MYDEGDCGEGVEMAKEQKSNVIEILRALDDKLDEICQHVVSNIQHSNEFKDEMFEKPYIFTGIDDRPRKLRGKKGIYVFEITQDIPMSEKQVRAWNERCKGAGFNEWFQRDLKKGDILYVGSCISESLFVRTRQHFLDKTTATSLRLGHPARKMAYNSVRVYAYPINNGYETYYRYIIPQVEKKLHEDLKPKAGSSRV